MRQVIGYVEQRVLGGVAHRRQPFDRNSVGQQRLVGYAAEQGRVGRVWSGRRDCDLLDPLAYLDELRRAGHGMALDLAPLGPTIGGIVMPDITKQHARRGLVHDQPDIGIDSHRPEIRVSSAVEPMEMQAPASRIELQIERCHFDRFLLRPGQSRETVGEGIRDAEFHHRTGNTFMTSSPRWLMTLTAMRPDLGLGNGREVSLLRLAQASSSISALSVVFSAL